MDKLSSYNQNSAGTVDLCLPGAHPGRSKSSLFSRDVLEALQKGDLELANRLAGGKAPGQESTQARGFGKLGQSFLTAALSPVKFFKKSKQIEKPIKDSRTLQDQSAIKPAKKKGKIDLAFLDTLFRESLKAVRTFLSPKFLTEKLPKFIYRLETIIIPKFLARVKSAAAACLAFLNPYVQILKNWLLILLQKIDELVVQPILRRLLPIIRWLQFRIKHVVEWVRRRYLWISSKIQAVSDWVDKVQFTHIGNTLIHPHR